MNIAISAGSAASTNVLAPVSLGRVLVALDQSDHANQALAQILPLVAGAGGEVTGIHAYAAALHDRRFRQMEGGLPEQYRRESEMEHQREVHEDLIGMGLGLITDSYHDAAEIACDQAGVPFHRLSPEGKNYACLVAALETRRFDVLAMGAFGLGAVPGSTIGSVCERVVRRSPIDVFVARDRHLALGDGPIVVGMDGSAKSFGAFETALAIGRRLDIAVHVVAAYDPYYHYVAFNKIAGVLDEERGKVFRFKEQEKLHEELIDEGIAKIYQAHLAVARKMAEDAGATVETRLLAGKPWQAIRKYLEKSGASLLMIGKTGVHGDGGLDIGGNAENLLRLAPCHIWLSQAEKVPPSDMVAAQTILWSDEAEAAINRAPDFVRAMARTAVVRAAQEAHHTYITSGFVTEIMRALMPGGGGPGGDKPLGAGEKPGFQPLVWGGPAGALLRRIDDEALRENIRLRAEKSARRDASDRVEIAHITPFLEDIAARDDGAAKMPPNDSGDVAITWSAASLARLVRVPDTIRDQVRRGVETYARQHGATRIEGKTEEAAFSDLRKNMCPADNASD